MPIYRKTYRLGDRPSREEREALRGGSGIVGGEIRAVTTGEHRPPGPGEWFLDGGPEICAMKAKRQCKVPRFIVKLVLVRNVTIWEEIPRRENAEAI